MLQDLPGNEKRFIESDRHRDDHRQRL